MSAKCVYNSLVVAVYVTRPDLDKFIQAGDLQMDVYVGKRKVEGARAALYMDSVSGRAIVDAYRTDQAALEKARQAYQVAHPRRPYRRK